MCIIMLVLLCMLMCILCNFFIAYVYFMYKECNRTSNFCCAIYIFNDLLCSALLLNKILTYLSKFLSTCFHCIKLFHSSMLTTGQSCIPPAGEQLIQLIWNYIFIECNDVF